jgi:hypothetical protein
VNAGHFSVEVVNENDEPDDRADASLKPFMCVPFLAEEVEQRDAHPPHGIKTVAAAGEQHKVRKRDMAPSPPRSRGQAQLGIDMIEVLAPSKIRERTPSIKSTRSTVGSDTSIDQPVATPTSTTEKDDRSLSSLYGMISDAFSFVDSTASTQKACGGRKGGSQNDDYYSLLDDDDVEYGGISEEISVPITRIGSQSTISSKQSDFSEMNDDFLMGMEELDSVPEDDTLDSAIVTTKYRDLFKIYSPTQFSSSSLKHLRRSKGKSSKVLKRNLQSLSVLVYGKRIARHNFMHEIK